MSTTRASQRRRLLFAVAAITLLGFVLRLVDIEGRSLWLDEGFSLLRMQGSWSALFSNFVPRQTIPTTDLHPPLYFALLKAWNTLVSSDALLVLRLLSVAASVVAIPATAVGTFRLARCEACALLSSLLAAIAPAYLWQATELRMYSLVTALGALSLASTLGLLQGDKLRPLSLLSWTALTAAGCFTHYSFLVFAAISLLVVLVSLLTAAKRGLLLAASFLIAFALLLGAVWHVTPLPMMALSPIARLQSYSLKELRLAFLAEVLNALAFGFNAGDPTGGGILALIALLMFAGFMAGSRLGRSAFGKHAAALFLAVGPVWAWMLIDPLLDHSASARYVLYSLPAAHALIAQSLLLLQRNSRLVYVLKALVALLAITPTAFGAWMTYVRTPTWQDDWRGMAEHLRQHLREGDGILLSLHASESALSYYLGVPIERLEMAGAWRERSATEVSQILGRRYARLWVVTSGSESDYWNNFVLTVARPFALLQEITFPARTTILRLHLFEIAPLILPHPPPSSLAFPEHGPLAALKLAPANLQFARPAFGLVSYWRNVQPRPSHLGVKVSYKGETWYDFRIQTSLPVSLEGWQDGKLYATHDVFPLWVGLPRLPYTLEVTALDAQGRALHRASWTLPTELVDSFLRWRKLNEPAIWAVEGLALVRAEYPPELQEGQMLPVALTWRVEARPQETWRVRLSVLGADDPVVTERDALSYPWQPSEWPVGEVVRDQYTLLTDGLSLGRYSLELRLLFGDRSFSLPLGKVAIQPAPVEEVPLDFDHSVGARVGPLTLLGYRVEPFAGGDALTLITYWRVEEKPTQEGRLFAHLFSADGKFIAQDDGAPFNGARTMRSLRPGQHIRQMHLMRAAAPLQQGTYVLFAGAYTAETLERWTAIQDGKPAPNNLVRLGEYTLR
ncbi:MAG: hypothetical protein NZL91_00065 [Thermoflexales bacterium]|nr:hypothetical protein [Thermoflexales bacterium]